MAEATCSAEGGEGVEEEGIDGKLADVVAGEERPDSDLAEDPGPDFAQDVTEDHMGQEGEEGEREREKRGGGI